MRNTFIKELVQHAKKFENIALIIGDLGFSVIEPFAEEFPDRFINAGIAEQNMTGVAAGMASEGYHVFTYSIANFPLFRCAEQIRNDIDYHNLPVTIVAVGGGLAYGNLGYSHHGVQDFAFIRSLPNMLIAAPGDPLELEACLDYLIKYPQPSYLRLNKTGEPNIHTKKPQISPGGLQIIKKSSNSDKLFLTTGAVLEIAVDIWGSDNEIKDGWSIGSLPMWGDKYRNHINNQLKNYSQIVTIEEHLLSGGFGSFLLELGLNNKPVFLESKVCGEVGQQSSLKRSNGINKAQIIKHLENIL